MCFDHCGLEIVLRTMQVTWHVNTTRILIVQHTICISRFKSTSAAVLKEKFNFFLRRTYQTN